MCAIAVVISLFYVGFQIKDNTGAVRSATAQAVHDNYADWYMNLMGDAELNRIAIKGLKDYSSTHPITDGHTVSFGVNCWPP